MSKKNSELEKSRALFQNYIKETISESNSTIINILQKEYHVTKNKLSQIFNFVETSTVSTMFERYNYKRSSEYRTSTSEYISAQLSNYPDYLSWTYTALQMPFYQSLGDTIGYYNGNWEFNYGNINAGPEFTNELIYEFISFGGINDISIKNWLGSDDTILYFETFKVVFDTYHRSLKSGRKIDINTYGQSLKDAYLNVKTLISNRHPGKTTMYSLDILSNAAWDSIQYNSQAIGNGSAMRAGPIGIFFPGSHNREKLVMLAVECSRITHNSGIAILGCVSAALFTAYSLERISIELWPHKLLKFLKSDIVDKYIKKSRPNDFSRYVQDKVLFVGKWDSYVTFRFNGTKPRTDLRFMTNPVERYRYLVEKFSKGCDFPGGCADDCLIMAYDSLLQSGGVYEKLVVYSMLHPGDSDTVGSVASSWFGGFYDSIRNQTIIGTKFDDLEFFDKINYFVADKYYDMIPVYYRDIYLNVARKYIRQFFSSQGKAR